MLFIGHPVYGTFVITAQSPEAEVSSHLSRVETELLKYFNYLTLIFLLRSFTFYIFSSHSVTKMKNRGGKKGHLFHSPDRRGE